MNVNKKNRMLELLSLMEVHTASMCLFTRTEYLSNDTFSNNRGFNVNEHIRK